MGKSREGNPYPENSPESVHAAVEHGVDMVEVDVRLTRCGNLVSHHDPALPNGMLICNSTLIECLQAGVHALSELLIAAERVPVNIDVKTSTADAVLPWEESTGGRLAAMLAEYRHPHDVVVTSFDPSVPLLLKDAVPYVSIGLLGWPTYPLRKLIPAATHMGLHVIAFDVSSTRENPIDNASAVETAFLDDDLGACRHLGVTTICYGATPADLDRLFTAGVDIACVDDVPAALSKRDRFRDSASTLLSPSRPV